MSDDTLSGDFGSAPTQRMDKRDKTPATPNDALREPTRVMGGRPAPAAPSAPAPSASVDPAQKTQLFRPGRPAPAAGQADVAPTPAATVVTGEVEPVVGWLVVVKGPGKGSGLSIGYGWNTVGRGADQRIVLDFGDAEISRENHCSITYDAKNRKFYVQHGGGRNLTYLGAEPVLMPKQLQNLDEITLGNTSLKFVALCGDQFDWSDIPE